LTVEQRVSSLLHFLIPPLIPAQGQQPNTGCPQDTSCNKQADHQERGTTVRNSKDGEHRAAGVENDMDILLPGGSDTKPSIVDVGIASCHWNALYLIGFTK